MAKIIKNVVFDETIALNETNMPYLFDAEDGTPVVGCKTWLETSKKNKTHPDGKPWILLPKNNPTNRRYFSEDKFNAENVDGEITVEVKTSAPRVLGSSGVKQDIIKYLDDDTAAEYTNLVNTAVDAYKAAKANNKKKKLEDMDAEELQAYIDALKSGKTYVPVGGTDAKSFLDMFTEDQYNRYNEIIALAAENKANAPKATRGPLSDEEKAARKAKREANELSKAEKLLAALQAKPAAPVDEDVDDYDDEDIDDIDDTDLDDDN